MLISVVIPTLNRPTLLLEAAKSIAGQDYAEWEAVVVDDGSTPPVDRAALKTVLGDRFTVVRHDRPRGIPEAKNAGLHAASGEIITCLDDDDLLAENALSRVAASFKANKGLDCVFLNVKAFGRHAVGAERSQSEALGKLLQRVETEEKDGLVFFRAGLFEALLKSVPLALQRPAARRGAWNIVGGYTPGLLFSEPDWAIRASAVCRMALLKAPLSLWRCDDQNFASRPAMFGRAVENAVRSAELLSQWCNASQERSRTRARQVRRFLGDAYFGHAYHTFEAGGKLPWKSLARSFLLSPHWRQLSLSLKGLLPRKRKAEMTQGARSFGLNRSAILQATADRIAARTYLEIGVQSGDTFFPLRIAKKIAVDPRFAFAQFAKLNWIRWNWRNLRNEYRPMPSDAFFAKHRQLLRGRKLDLVFVDGLHTYEQSLKDIRNALQHLDERGVIVVDDCNPQSEGAASPAKAAAQVIWNGDVWKSIAYLRATEPGLRICTLDVIFGLAIVQRGRPESRLECDPDRIGSMTYEYFDKHRHDLLNLKPASYLPHLLRQLGSASKEDLSADQYLAKAR